VTNQTLPPCARRLLEKLIADAERSIATNGEADARLGIVERGELHEGQEKTLFRDGGPTGKVWCSTGEGTWYVEYRAADVLAACQTKLKEGWMGMEVGEVR
jgi:hypothetical protein